MALSHLRVGLALTLVALPLVAWWHLEIIYPIRPSTAGALSSGWVRIPAERPATAFWHLLKYCEVAVAVAAAIYILSHE